MSEERIESKAVRMADREDAYASEEPTDGQREKKPYRPGPVIKLTAALLAACAAAAGLLLLLAFVSFRMRFSADVVRAGILGLYVLPCLLGGRMARGFKLNPAPLWGAGLGAAFYGVLLLVSRISAGPGEHAVKIGLLVPTLCVVGGLLGSLIGRKQVKKPDEAGK